MDKFIKLLLETENTVILPGFGAIVVENENTGKLMFNEYLKFNDGKLDDTIVANSNMDIQEAQNYVAKYVREIQMQIGKGESYDIYQLGKFFKTEDGSIEFEGNKIGGRKAQDEVQGPSPTPETPKTAVEQKEIVSLEESVEEQSVSSIFEKKEIPTEIKSESADEKPLHQTESKEAIPQPTEEKNEAIVEKKSSSEESDEAQNQPEKAQKKKRGVLFYIILLLLVLVIGGGVFVALNYEEVRTYMGWNDIEKPSESKVIADISGEEDGEQRDSENESENEEGSGEQRENEEENENENENERGEQVVEQRPVAVSQGQGGRFHIIVGSFGDANNANRFVDELKSNGHNASVAGERNGLQLVSVASFNNRQEANNAKSNYQQISSSAWVYEAK